MARACDPYKASRGRVCDELDPKGLEALTVRECHQDCAIDHFAPEGVAMLTEMQRAEPLAHLVGGRATELRVVGRASLVLYATAATPRGTRRGR